MGYRIEYGASETRKRRIPKVKPSVPVMAAGFFALFLLMTVLFWPEGKAVLLDLILPGDGAVTAGALQGLVSDLRAGESVGDAVTVFCREIIAHGSQ